MSYKQPANVLNSADRNPAAESDKCQLECHKLSSQVSDTVDRKFLSTCRPASSLSVKHEKSTTSQQLVQRFCHLGFVEMQ